MRTRSAAAYFYPRSPRGERPRWESGKIKPSKISIHAPREGSDFMVWIACTDQLYFYPRSPRGERPVVSSPRIRASLFLSTLPARGATLRHRQGQHRPSISIHAPREGSDLEDFKQRYKETLEISIHAPREGSDGIALYRYERLGGFLSTLPARGATSNLPINWLHFCHFYPRSPRGERPASFIEVINRHKFLSTLPARGATDT